MIIISDLMIKRKYFVSIKNIRDVNDVKKDNPLLLKHPIQYSESDYNQKLQDLFKKCIQEYYNQPLSDQKENIMMKKLITYSKHMSLNKTQLYKLIRSGYTSIKKHTPDFISTLIEENYKSFDDPIDSNSLYKYFPNNCSQLISILIKGNETHANYFFKSIFNNTIAYLHYDRITIQELENNTEYDLMKFNGVYGISQYKDLTSIYKIVINNTEYNHSFRHLYRKIWQTYSIDKTCRQQMIIRILLSEWLNTIPIAIKTQSYLPTEESPLINFF